MLCGLGWQITLYRHGNEFAGSAGLYRLNLRLALSRAWVFGKSLLRERRKHPGRGRQEPNAPHAAENPYLAVGFFPVLDVNTLVNGRRYSVEEIGNCPYLPGALSGNSATVPTWLSLIAYHLGNLWRPLVLPKRIGNGSLTSLQQRLVKTGGRLIKHARYYWLLLAEGHLSRRLFGAMVLRITALPVPDG